MKISVPPRSWCFRSTSSVLTLGALCAGLMMGSPAHAQSSGLTTAQAVRQNSSLYYAAGGGDPTPLAANPNSLNLRFGLSGNLALGYSCGRFRIGDAFAYYMSEFRNLGVTLQAAIGAAIAALPMYIFQRAQPGLYEIFQSYWAKAQIAIAAALKTCEEMEAQIKAGGDPYADYLNMAKGEAWKSESDSGNNVVSAKENVQRNGGQNGVQAFQGIQRGGRGQPPLRIVHDITAVGYNATMNQPPSASETTVYPNNTLLGKLWSTPQAAADWGVSVLGDQEIATCTDPNCGTSGGGVGKAVATGLGLRPKYEAAVTEAQTAMSTVLASTNLNYTDLQLASAPGVAITKDVIDSLLRLPPDTRSTMTARLTQEVALAKTIERAFMLRNLIQTGMTASNYEKPVDEARNRVAQLNRYIDDLMFEMRVRREIVSSTSLLLIENDRNSAAARASGIPAGREGSPRTLEEGRVNP